MKNLDFRTALVVLGFFVLGGLVTGSLTGTAYAQSKGKGWEYSFLPCGKYSSYSGGSISASEINKSAGLGWEMVPVEGLTPATDGTCLFRRSK